MRSLSLNFFLVSLVIKHFFGFAKFLIFFSVALLYILHHLLIILFFPKSAFFTQYHLKSTKFFARLSLFALGVNINYRPQLSDINEIKGLIISNHISYLDILVILSHHPTFFVTSLEIKNSFFLGHLSRLAMCIFVERRKELRTQDSIHSYIREISKKLNGGYNVCLFPEGTTTDGSSVLPFKVPLFKAAEITNTPVHLLAISYIPQQRSMIAWYGEMSFLSYFFNLCCERKIDVELIHVSSSCVVPNMDIKDFAKLANSQISKKLF